MNEPIPQFDPESDPLVVEGNLMAAQAEETRILVSIRIAEFPEGFPEEWTILDRTAIDGTPSFWVRPEMAQYCMEGFHPKHGHDMGAIQEMTIGYLIGRFFDRVGKPTAGL